MQGDDLGDQKTFFIPHEIVTLTGVKIGNGAYGAVYEVNA